jgi:ribose transport system permease protein
LKKILKNEGALIALITLVVVNTIWQKGLFLQPENLLNILSQSAFVGIVALGMTLVIIGGGIDLSVGSIASLAATFGILALNKVGEEPKATLVAVLVAIFSGAVIGLINGFVITWGRVAPFIATLAGLIAFRSIALAITDARQVSTESLLFGNIAQKGIPLGLQNDAGRQISMLWPVVIFFMLAFVTSWILNKTVYGRRLIATGANEQAAIYSGIATHRVKWVMYTLLGALCGVAAVLKGAQLNSVSASQLGQYFELDAIAAAVIGGTSLSGGRGQVWRTVLGVLILGIINNMLSLSGINSNWQGCVKGVIILLAVLIQRGGSKK